MLQLCAFADEAGSSLAEQIAALQRNRIPNLELRSIDGKNVLDFTEDEARAYAKELADAGITVFSIGSPLGKVDITCDFEEYLGKVRHILSLCKIFSCTRVRMFSFFKAGDEAEDEVVARLCRMVELAEGEGIHLYHENEKDIFGDVAERVEKLICRVPGLRFIYDPANFIQCGQDMQAAMDSLLGKIGYFHIKDVIRETGELVPAGEGDGLLRELIARIPRDATLTIEPHLAVFAGYGQIDNTEMKNKYIYKNNQDSFDAACAGLRKVLSDCGYEETEKGWVKKMIRYGIIGVGNMGSAHLENFQKGLVPDACVTAIADHDEGKLARMKEKFPDGGFACYSEGKDLIDAGNVDAVIVAIPHYFHPEMSIYAMKKGIAVVCEKPAGVYTKQVKEMNAVAKETGVPFTMMFNQRTNCIYRKMREIVQEGGVGEIKRVNWMITNWYRAQCYYDSGSWRATWRGEGGGVLLNQCPHQLDLLQWVVGMMPINMRAFCHFGKWHDIEVEDDVTAYFEYENGATGVFITSTADAPGTNRFEILGTAGKLVCEHDKLTYIKCLPNEREFCRTYQGGFGEPKYETVPVETDGQNLQHVGILRNFTNYLLGKEELFVDGTEGLKGVYLMDSMLYSTFINDKVSIPFDDDAYYAELQKRVATGRVKAEGAGVVLDTSSTYAGGGKK